MFSKETGILMYFLINIFCPGSLAIRRGTFSPVVLVNEIRYVWPINMHTQFPKSMVTF